MRKSIVAVVAAGTLGVSGLFLAGPALAAVGATSAASTAAAPSDRIKEALAGLVTDKTLTQAQADKVASTLQAADLGRSGPGGHGGGPGGGGPGGDLSTAATALGLSEADLRAALESGKTLAQVAKDKGVSVDTLVSALVKAEKERIAKAVTDGKLTQAQADEQLADLTKRVTERVNRTRPTGGKGGRGDHGPGQQPTPSTSATPSASPSAS